MVNEKQQITILENLVTCKIYYVSDNKGNPG